MLGDGGRHGTGRSDEGGRDNKHGSMIRIPPSAKRVDHHSIAETGKSSVHGAFQAGEHRRQAGRISEARSAAGPVR